MSDNWPGQRVADWPGQPAGKIPSQEPMGTGEQFLTGLQDPIVGGRQLFTHLSQDPQEVKRIDEQVREREAQIQRQGGGGLVRGLGAATTSAPLMALGPVGPIAGGAVSGALEPTTGENFLGEKTKQAVTGGAISGVTAGAGKGLSALIGAPLRQDAARLISEGVETTPGQTGGVILRRLEEAAKSIPILGTFVRNAEERSVRTFNQSVLNQALEPIGQKLPANVVAGHDAIRQTHKLVSDAYNTLLPNMRLVGDPTLVNDLRAIRYNASTLPAEHQTQFENIMKQHIIPFFNPAPNVKKQGIKDMEASLRYESDLYRRSQNPNDVKLSARLDEVRESLHEALKRQNPTSADLLRKVDTAYAMVARAEGAAGRRATSEGVFTPNDLLQTIKSQDKSARKRSFAAGDSLMQVYAETAQRVLPSKLPDSGTPERLLTLTGLPMGLAGLPAAPIWSQRGSQVVRDIMQNPDRQAIASVLRKISPYGAIGAEPILRQLGE